DVAEVRAPRRQRECVQGWFPLVGGWRSMTVRGLFLSACVAALAACGGKSESGGSGDAAMKSLASEILQDYYRRHPSAATLLGVHPYDDRLEDYSAAGFAAEATADSAFRARLLAVDTTKLSLEQQLDRQQLIHAMDAAILSDRVVKPWAQNADS